MPKSFPVKTHHLWCPVLLVLLVELVGCSNKPQSDNNKPKVVATSTVVCDVAKQIAQDTVDLKCLIEPGSDPHEYQPKPGDSVAIEQANLILYAGYNFEPGLIKLIQATSNPAPKIAVDEVAVPTPQQFEDDGKSVTDPHVFHNALNGVRIVETVRDRLKTLAPSNTDQYTKNAQKITSELTQIHEWIKTQISTIPTHQRKLVTTHDAFGYYSKAYGIPLAGALQGVSSEEAPTAKRVAELVKSIKESGVPTIFAETTINPKLIQQVATEAHVKVSDRELFADGLGEQGTVGDSYQKLLIANTRTITEGLGGNYKDFQTNSALVQPAHSPSPTK